MSNYTHVTPELIERVRRVIADSVRHTYSVSRVYGAYNEAMKKNELPQTCGSCLKRRVRELKIWLAEYERQREAKHDTPNGKERTVKKPGGERYELLDGKHIVLENGKARNEEGKGLTAGKYETKDGGRIIVAPGRRARYVAVEEQGSDVENRNELVDDKIG